MIESALLSAQRGGCQNALCGLTPAGQRRQQCDVAARSCNKPPADSPLTASAQRSLAKSSRPAERLQECVSTTTASFKEAQCESQTFSASEIPALDTPGTLQQRRRRDRRLAASERTLERRRSARPAAVQSLQGQPRTDPRLARDETLAERLSRREPRRKCVPLGAYGRRHPGEARQNRQ